MSSEHFDKIYVTKEECAKHREQTAKEITSTNVELAGIKTTLKIVVGILAAIGVAVLPAVIKYLVSGG